MISLDMQSFPEAFLVLSLLIPYLISSNPKGLLSCSKLIFFLQSFHNVLRLFDVISNFLFTASETMRDYYL